jgi:hypothetical protein
VRDPNLENKAVGRHWLRRELNGLLRGTPGVPAAASLWQQLAGQVSLVDPTGSLIVDTLLRLAAGCNFEAIATSPPSLSGSANDYQPLGGLFVRLTASADVNITGLAGNGTPTPGEWRVLYNASAYRISLPIEGGSSTAALRFHHPTLAWVVLQPGDAALCVYDPLRLTGRWVVSKLTGGLLPEDAALGKIAYGDNSVPSVWTGLAGNTSTTRKFLRQTGTGSVSGVPVWDTLTAGDLEPAGRRTVMLGADRTSTSGTLADVTGLSFSVEANANYSFEFEVIFQTDNVGRGIYLSLNGPASPTQIVFDRAIYSAIAATNHAMARAYDDAAGKTGTVDTANADCAAVIRGVLRNGANAGALIVRFALGDGISGTTVKVMTGSAGWIQKL